VYLAIFPTVLLLPAAMGAFILRKAFASGSSWGKLAGVVAGPVLFYAASSLLVAHMAAGIRAAGDRVCGAFGGFAFIAVVGGTLVELCFSVMLFTGFLLVAYFRRRRAATA
jgi:hypothetical protein